jgi:pentafunctional AROM polypeptide
MEGKEPENALHDHRKNINRSSASIFIIGMRGAGKTTTGRWAVKSLAGQHKKLIDLDTEMEERESRSIPDIVRNSGWEYFRKVELDILKSVIKELPKDHVFACGGGVVESAEARKLLIDWHKKTGHVLLVERDINQVMDFLNIDKTRPAYVEDMMGVWLRRKPWFEECSNVLYYSQRVPGENLSQAAEDFDRFLQMVTGKYDALAEMKRKPQSFFVALTYPDLRPYLHTLSEVAFGSDAVELRVDLLNDPQSEESIPSLDFVTSQLSLLRATVPLPVVFTIRTKSQGGAFPDDSHKEALALYKQAIKMGSEFVDLEVTTFPEALLNEVLELKNSSFSRIIASHHDPRAELSWSKNGSWIPVYNKCLQYGDIVKLCGVAKTQEDNFSLRNFKSWAARSHPDVPVIAINMGRMGQTSRILNNFMTPVSHPALPFKAAPGQLSAKEIRTALALMGEIAPQKFFLFGTPISASKSPALHNTLFQTTGLPHNYERCETDDLATVKSIIHDPDFGGASVTIPLKLEIMNLLDSVDETARIIGAVNTIVPIRDPQQANRPKLIGRNTDYTGMMDCLRSAGASGLLGEGTQAGLVIGGGGTARAAIQTLHSMSYSPIYLLGRSVAKVTDMAATFPSNYNIKVVDASDASNLSAFQPMPRVAIATIPANVPIDPALAATLNKLFLASKADKDRSAGERGVLLEMAYRPAYTNVMQMAEEVGRWKTIQGLETLVTQGMWQFEHWTGVRVRGVAAGLCRVSFPPPFLSLLRISKKLTLSDLASGFGRECVR